ncbi:MAG: mandelate racemase/muconate lactonizing enzyme family protein [Candidatus Latescibacteria bacterium]|nr:mandelate racemase/muconate lactonizing enzyme family protein [Candidatus Latescibacterota bacterium]
MKITDIRTAEVRGHGYSLFVRVYTDEGITGTGECIHGGSGAPQLVAAMKDMLIGENPLDVDRLFEKVRRAYIFNGALAGNVVTALTGIEIALWDLAGRAAGLPVYRLLGGKFRDKIRVYCDCHAGEENNPESYAKRAREVVAMGFNAIKFDIDDGSSPYKLDRWNWSITPGELHSMVDKVAAIRSAVGPAVDVCIDMHGRYDLSAGIRVAQALEPYDLMWLEEPVPPENVDAMREVKRSTKTPICTGENLYLRYGFRELLEQQAVDVIMPDIPKCGGLSECRKIANMAEVYYISFAPHNVCGPLGTIASCHVCASIPNFLVIEWHWVDRPHWHELVLADPPLIQNGYITVPDAPGLGVELNEEAARKYLRPGTGLFE